MVVGTGAGSDAGCAVGSTLLLLGEDKTIIKTPAITAAVSRIAPIFAGFSS